MFARSTSICIMPTEKHAVPLTENSFVDWIIDSFPGDKIVYYRGLLAHDRVPTGNVLDPRSRAELNAVARRVMTMASHGLVHPVQKRIGPVDFLYIAIKTKPGASANDRGLSAIPPSTASASEPRGTNPVLTLMAA